MFRSNLSPNRGQGAQGEPLYINGLTRLPPWHGFIRTPGETVGLSTVLFLLIYKKGWKLWQLCVAVADSGFRDGTVPAWLARYGPRRSLGSWTISPALSLSACLKKAPLCGGHRSAAPVTAGSRGSAAIRTVLERSERYLYRYLWQAAEAQSPSDSGLRACDALITKQFHGMRRPCRAADPWRPSGETSARDRSYSNDGQRRGISSPHGAPSRPGAAWDTAPGRPAGRSGFREASRPSRQRRGVARHVGPLGYRPAQKHRDRASGA